MGNLRFLTVFIFSILFSLVGFTQEQKELLLNGGFESGVAKWKSYCDAAGITPVDGVGGGVAGFAISASTTSPLAGKSSGIITKDAANRQGCGVATDFTVQEENKAQVLQVKIPYKITSGTYADDQYKVYVYDIDNASMIEVAPTFIKNSSIKETYRGTFQTSLTGVNYRLIIHNASTSAVASTMKIEGNVSSQLVGTGSFSTDFVSYTNNCSGSFTTNTTYSCKQKIIGDEVEFQINLTFSGAPNASNLTLNIPYTIDTTKLVSTTPDNLIFGKGSILDVGIKGYPIHIDYTSTTSVRVIIPGTDQTHIYNAGFVTATTPFTIGSGDSISVTFKVPVVGKTSNTVLSNEYTARDIVAHIGNTTGQSISTGSDVRVQYSVATVDSHGITTLGSNAKITASVPGCYDVDSLTTFTYASWAINDGFTVKIKKNGSSIVLASGIGIENANNFSKAAPVSGVVCLNTGDYVETYINLTRAAGATTLNGDNTQNYLILKLRSSGVQVATSESIAARYKTAAGQSIANASTPVIDFGTKEFDDVGSVTTGGSWKFTPNAAGKFEVCVRVRYANGQVWTATTSYAAAYLYKNGSSYSALGEVFFPATTTPSNSGPHLPGCDVIKLLSTDFIDVRTAHNESSARTLLGSDAHNWITIKRVGNY